MLERTINSFPYHPYYDSFNEYEHIHKLRFSPGDNVTYEDLNVLQTIIQDQVSLFGSYFLTPDSVVSGGDYKIISDVNLVGIRLDTAFGGFLGLPKSVLTINELKPNTYFQDLYGKNVVLISYPELNTDDSVYYMLFSTLNPPNLIQCPFLYLYDKNTTAINEDKFILLHKFGTGEQGLNTDTYYSTQGNCISFTETILFIEGIFVYVPAQTRIVTFEQLKHCSVGFELSKSIITVDEDTSLEDNALSYEAVRSPGADRYQIQATLKVIPIIEDESFLDVTVKDSFIEYLRIKDGVVIKDARLPTKSEFAKTLARRTFDESGSYTVKPFRIKIEDYTPTEFIIRIFPGKAYVNGYEIEYLTERQVILPRLTNVAYYRADKLVIDSSGRFFLLKGTEYPDKPVLPKDKDGAMTLYHFLFKPNSTTINNIGIKYINNRRYTMRDIGKIESRIENLEYYTNLSLLEKQTSDQKILDQNGNSRFKNGFMVDNFKTYNSVDLSTRDNRFSFDLQKGYLRPTFDMYHLGLTFNATDSTNVVLNGELITLPFTEVPLIEQLQASTIVNVNPYEVFVWEGKLTLIPQNVFWVDTNTKPALTVNHYGNEDVWKTMGEEGFRFEWGSWDSKILAPTTDDPDKQIEAVMNKDEQRLWNPKVDSSVDKTLLDKYQVWITSNFVDGFAKLPDGYVEGDPAVFITFTKMGEQAQFSSSILTKSLGSSVKGIELAPYIKGQVVQFTGEGFKPSSTLYAFFGDRDATNWCTMDETNFGVLTTDAGGFIRGSIHLPEKTFTIGSYNFKLTDDRTETAQLTTTFGVAKFYAKGMVQTKQETYISTREPELLSSLIDTEIVIPTTPTPTPTITPTPSSGVTNTGGGLGIPPSSTPLPSPYPQPSPTPFETSSCGVTLSGYSMGEYRTIEVSGTGVITIDYELEGGYAMINVYEVAPDPPLRIDDRVPMDNQISYTIQGTKESGTLKYAKMYPDTYLGVFAGYGVGPSPGNPVSYNVTVNCL